MGYLKKICLLAFLALPLVACKPAGGVNADPTIPPKEETGHQKEFAVFPVWGMACRLEGKSYERKEN